MQIKKHMHMNQKLILSLKSFLEIFYNAVHVSKYHSTISCEESLQKYVKIKKYKKYKIVQNMFQHLV